MKIDKVIFSTSESFSVFWNIQSKIWRSFGIEPVCLLFGKKQNTNMHEKYGKIIEMPIIENIPLLIQITWSKFYWPTLEPETTWLIGDIDLLPLQSYYFIENIKNVPDENYAHLNCDGITQLSGQKSWVNANINNLTEDYGHATNLPGHYHCAKGKIFKIGLDINGTFEQELRHIVDSKLYNNTRAYRASDPIDQHDLWCAEENRSTKSIRKNIKNNKILFSGFSLKNGIKDHGGINGDTIDRTMYDEQIGKYIYDNDKLITKKYIDLHCVRPFNHVNEERRNNRWKANFEILEKSEVLMDAKII